MQSGYHSIFRHLDPEIDVNRVVMKVPATWEGLQACKTLTTEGVQTLATTVFSMEQCILAGEAGCVSISPFIHDLKRLTVPRCVICISPGQVLCLTSILCHSYKDDDPLIGLCVEAQSYFKQHDIPTRVKACSTGSVDEILQLAGVDAHTLELADINTLAAEEYDQGLLESRSLFKAPKTPPVHIKGTSLAYNNDEARFRVEFASSRGGRSQLKLYRVGDPQILHDTIAEVLLILMLPRLSTSSVTTR